MSFSRVTDSLRRVWSRGLLRPSGLLMESMRFKTSGPAILANHLRTIRLKYRPHEEQVLFEDGKLAERWLLRYEDLKKTKTDQQLALYESAILRAGRCLEYWKKNILGSGYHDSWASNFWDFFIKNPDIAEEFYYQLYPVKGKSKPVEEAFGKILRKMTKEPAGKLGLSPVILDIKPEHHYVLAMTKLMANVAKTRNAMTHRHLEVNPQINVNDSALRELGVRGDLEMVLHLMERLNGFKSATLIEEARIKEKNGDSQAAWEIIKKCCEGDPENEDLWLEAERLNSPVKMNGLIEDILQEFPSSARLWIKAAELKSGTEAKRRVFSDALDTVQTSASLWKLASELEEADVARVLLSQAVIHCPYSAELWIALARLETYDNAKKTLTGALECTWSDRFKAFISLAKLEEPRMTLTWSARSLNAAGIAISRKLWLDEAVCAEKEGFVVTCRAIIRTINSMDGLGATKKHTQLKDAEFFEAQEALECARTTYAYALQSHPTSKKLWKKSALLEQKHGSRESLQSVLREAVLRRPDVQHLWLMLAKSQKMTGDVDGAKATVSDALKNIFELETIGKQL